MRPLNQNTVYYNPEPAPVSESEYRSWVDRELQKVRMCIELLAAGHVDTSYVAPFKPREGDIRLTDGVQWNPGSGQGVYCYYNSTWNKLG